VDRARRVQDLWSWLPAFRAVAETEHLPTAAKRLHVTPSALSRSVRLLEQELGHPLFHRVGRNLKLSDAGEAFLAAVRDAMRLVDDGMAAVTGGRLDGALAVASPDAVLPAVLDVAATLGTQHPGLVVHIHQVRVSDAPARLLDGQLDVALVGVSIEHERLTREGLGALSCGLYVGPGHALYQQTDVELADVVRHPFVALTPSRDGAPDPWPATIERVVTLYVERMGIARATCFRGEHIAVLPDVLTRADDELFRLPIDDVTQPLPLFSLQRQTLMPGGKAEVFLDSLRARLGA